MMRLEAFRVQNYKKIRDTGWVSCRDLTVFVGKNEAGKSAIFRGLSKINPSDGEEYDGLREFPRRRYTDEFSAKDWPVGSARFVLGEAERDALSQISVSLSEVKTVTVTRSYSWTLSVAFEPQPQAALVSTTELRETVDEVIVSIQELTAPEGMGDALGGIKQAILPNLEQLNENVPEAGVATKQQIDVAINAIAEQANEEWQKTLLDPVLAPFRDLSVRAAEEDKFAAARKWVSNHLPKFIYFDKYDVIDSAIHVPTFIQQLQSDPGAPRTRTTQCLFDHVGLDVEKLAQLGTYDPEQPEHAQVRRQIDERAILSSSASNAMTQKFQDWWEQRKHAFHYQLDGDYFRIWVSDDADPSEIELDQRSAGMQYFFSFYTVFLVESASAHANSILLLDEPGLHVHGTAQYKIVKFLESLSEENQTLYTTHSPFMVDVDHLENTRAVYEDEEGTTAVSEDIWPRDRDSLFPLQAALGYQLVQGLFISKRQVIVEGLTDQWLLKALDHVLALKDRTRLRPDIIIVPSAGLSKLLPLASMLIGHEVEVAALLDGDEPARREGKRLVDRLLASNDRRCLFIGDFVDNSNAEIEDLFPESQYLAAVKEAYPGYTINFTKAEQTLSGVVNKVQNVFERKSLGRFEKWRPAAILRDQIVGAPDTVADWTLNVTESIFQSLNSLFTHETE